MFRSWLALVFAAVAFVPALFIVLPTPSVALLPLGVGAPEVSAWLGLHALFVLALALLDVRTRRASRIASWLSVTIIALSTVPFFRLQGVAANADEQMSAAFGTRYLDRTPTALRAALRPKPLVALDLLRGMPPIATPVRITRGVTVATIEGVALTTDIYQPLTPGTHPVLVQIYGGAWQRGTPDDFTEFATHVAGMGFVVFAIDYRHAPRFRFPAQIEDIQRDLAWIGANAASFDADTSRMVLVGRSAGAHLAMLAAYAENAPRIRGVINFYGPVDLIEGYRHPPVPDPLAVRSVEEAFLGGTPDDMIARYRAASPITLATRTLPPTLLLYGGRDHIVEARFGTQLARQLRITGTKVVHVELPQSEHAFDVIPNGPGGQLARYLCERFLLAVTATPS